MQKLKNWFIAFAGMTTLIALLSLAVPYADRGTMVRCAAIRSGTTDNASAVGFTLAGYLVDVPPSAPQ